MLLEFSQQDSLQPADNVVVLSILLIHLKKTQLQLMNESITLCYQIWFERMCKGYQQTRICSKYRDTLDLHGKYNELSERPLGQNH